MAFTAYPILTPHPVTVFLSISSSYHLFIRITHREGWRGGKRNCRRAKTGRGQEKRIHHHDLR